MDTSCPYLGDNIPDRHLHLLELRLELLVLLQVLGSLFLNSLVCTLEVLLQLLALEFKQWHWGLLLLLTTHLEDTKALALLALLLFLPLQAHLLLQVLLPLSKLDGNVLATELGQRGTNILNLSQCNGYITKERKSKQTLSDLLLISDHVHT